MRWRKLEIESSLQGKIAYSGFLVSTNRKILAASADRTSDPNKLLCHCWHGHCSCKSGLLQEVHEVIGVQSAGDKVNDGPR